MEGGSGGVEGKEGEGEGGSIRLDEMEKGVNEQEKGRSMATYLETCTQLESK